MIQTNEVPQPRYGSGGALAGRSQDYGQGQVEAANTAPRPPISSAAQDLLPRISFLIERSSRISSLLRSVPKPPEGKPATPNQDLESTIQLAHGGLDYLEQVIADIERSLGV